MNFPFFINREFCQKIWKTHIRHVKEPNRTRSTGIDAGGSTGIGAGGSTGIGAGNSSKRKCNGNNIRSHDLTNKTESKKEKFRRRSGNGQKTTE